MKKAVLSTADVARLFGVTETTVKRWADEGTLRCQKTPGGHRKFDIRTIVEFAEKNSFDPVGTLEIVGDARMTPAVQVAIMTREHHLIASEFIDRALSDGPTDLFAFFSYLYEHKVPLREIHDLIIRPGMTEIGDRWVCGELGVEQEHRASHRTLEALAKLQFHIVVKPPRGLSVICACTGEELHEIGLRCASYVFQSEGWATHYLGARTPLSAVISAVHTLHPSVVCLSASVVENLPEVIEHLREIGGAAQAVGARVVAGGRAVTSELLRSGLCDAVLTSSREVLEFIHQFGKGEQRHRNTGSGREK